MHDQQHKQDEPGRPNQLGIGLKEVAVAVERFGPQKNLEVASQMTNDKKEQHETANRHEVLLAQ